MPISNLGKLIDPQISINDILSRCYCDSIYYPRFYHVWFRIDIY